MLSVDSLLMFVQLQVQSYASTVCMLKNPDTDSDIMGHAEILDTLVGLGSAALAAAVAFPR